MVDTVTLKFRVAEDGSLTALGQKADKASAGLDRTSKSARNTDRNLRGVAGMSSNTTKNFSKMQQGLTGGLVPAYAALAANVFAVTAAFGVLSRSAAVKQLNEGLMFTGRAAGTNLKIVSRNLQEITEGAISAADAMRAVAVATSAGFSEDQMQGLTSVAKGASQALGRDMTDALDRLVRGAAKLEPEILDELGIIVRLDRETEKYAASLGIATSELTEYQRRMAFTNAIVEQGQEKFGALSRAVDANPYNKLAAAFDNLVKSFMNGLNFFLGPFAEMLAGSTTALIAAMATLGTTVVRQMVPGISNAAEASRELADETAKTVKTQLGATKTFNGAPKVFDKLTAKIRTGEASQKDFARAQRSLTRSIEVHQQQMPGYVAAHGAGSTAVKAKEAKVDACKQALQELMLVETLETQATLEAGRADIIAAASAGKLGTTLSLLKVQLAAEYAQTMAAATGKGFFAAMTMLATFAAKSFAFSIYAVGIALLTAIPLIAGIGLALYSAYQMFKDFMGIEEEFDPLAEVLEDNKERMKEYPNIIAQMATAYAEAKTDVDRYTTAMKVQHGVMGQGLTQLNKIRMAEKAYAEEKRLDALTEANLAKERQADIQKQLSALGVDEATRNRILGESNEREHFFGLLGRTEQADSIAAIGGGVGTERTKAITQALADFVVQQDAVTESTAKAAAITSGPSNKALAMARVEMRNQIDVLTRLKSKTKENSDENKEYADKIEKIEAILKKMTIEGLDAAIQEFQNLKEEVGGAVDAMTALEEAGEKLNAYLKKNAQVTGPFSERIKLLRNIETARSKNILSGPQATTTLDQLAPINEKTGKRVARAGFNLEGLDELSGKALDAELGKRLKGMIKATELANERLKLERVTAAVRKSEFETLVAIGRKDLALKGQALQIENDITDARADLARMAADNKDTAAQELKILQLIAAAEKNRVDTIKERLDLGTSATGGDAGGILAGAAGLEEMLGKEFVDKDGKVIGTGLSKFNEADTAGKLVALKGPLSSVIEGFKKLGPEGEIVAAATEGMLNLATALTLVADSMEKINEMMEGPDGQNSFETMKAAFASGDIEAKVAGVAGATALAGAAFAGLFATMKMATNARIKDIDRQIAEEKRIDGQSAASTAKIAALEKKKEEAKKKAFEQDKKMKMAQVVMATSLAIMQAVANIPPPFGMALAAMFGAMGAAQLAIISGMSYQGGGATSPSSPEKVSVGERSNTVDLARGNNAGGELAYMRGESGTGRGATDFRPAFMGYTKTRAAGGYIVGEQGPELFMPDVPGEIIPSGQGAGASVNATFNISAIDATGVEDLLNEQKGNIIGMIRDAANDHGEFFLETVDTGAYN